MSVKPSRYDKKCIDFFRHKEGTYVGTNIKTWHFDPALKDEIKAFFQKTKVLILLLNKIFLTF